MDILQFPLEKFVSVRDFEEYALKTLPRGMWHYYNDGAIGQQTLADNVAAFSRYKLLPKYLVDVSDFDTSVTILGEQLACPIGISPMALQVIAHADGDKGMAKAAASRGAVFIQSENSSFSIENVAEASPGGCRWQQLYPYHPKSFMLELIRKAEAAGNKAIVLTVDRPINPTFRYSTHRNPIGHRLAGWTERNPNHKGGPYNSLPNSRELEFKQTWEDITWIRARTSLPIILKGILNASEVHKAVDAGVNGLLVSNHGGRVLDGVPATIDVLSSITRAAKDTGMEVFLDGGVRSGLDVFRAIALGAKMVFIGRPAMWGLTRAGQQGVEAVLDLLTKEFKITSQLCGAPTIQDIEESMILKSSFMP